MAPRDEAFARRIAALLVAVRDPGSSPEDAGADVLGRAVALLRAAGADAERLQSGAVVAGFDGPFAAIAAANQLHVAAGSTWRVGLHVGDVLMTGEGVETRQAIASATDLARRARPGTTAVAAAALTAIGRIHDATVDAPAEGAEGVVLVVPRRPGPSFERRRLVMVLAGATVGLAGLATWLTRMRPSAGDHAGPLTLAVASFRLSRDDPEHAWIGNALRTGLNTQLSELSGVKVYSQAFLDFVMSRERLSEIEVATRLSIAKMLTGTVLVVGDSVRVEAQIVDVASGVLEGAYTATGREADFLALENAVVLGVISKLDVQLSPEDEHRLAVRRAVDPDAFRRLLDAEGAGGTPPPSGPGSGGRRSPSSLLPAPDTAYADDGGAEVTAVLEDYRRATEKHDVTALGAMYLEFLPEQRVLLERYFASVRDLRVRIADVDVAVVGDEAVVSYTRIDDFVDIPTQRPQHLSLRVTRTLRRVDGRWRFAAVQ